MCLDSIYTVKRSFPSQRRGGPFEKSTSGLSAYERHSYPPAAETRRIYVCLHMIFTALVLTLLGVIHVRRSCGVLLYFFFSPVAAVLILIISLSPIILSGV